MIRILDDFLTFLGTTNGGGRWYLWWSGMFSNLTIFAAVAVFYRKHNCHIRGCLRIGTHKAVDAQGVEHVVCRSHHPELGAKHHLRPHHLVAGAGRAESADAR
ncbi:MAG: hypothetical protein ACXVFV_08695 [Mycobacteriales bacterium]